MMNILPLQDQLYILDDGRVRAFLVVGETQALLIDTGFADSGAFDTVRSITPLPITVLLTHADRDHAGGLAAFGECYVNEADWPLVADGITLHPLKEGDVFACGAYRFEVIAIPGHTYGSVAFFDREKGLLLSGDSVQKDGPIFMFGDHRNLDLYIESQRKLLRMADQIQTILPSHHDCPIDAGYIDKNLQDALSLRAGKLTGTPHPTMPCQAYKGNWTTFYYG